MVSSTRRPWQPDHEWSRRFLPEIKRILGEHLIAEAPAEEDALRNTDLIVLKLDAVRIACRVRRHRFVQEYGDQFTIRVRRPNGVKSELGKVLEGWGDYLFYGFADADERHLCAWLLGDLHVFRGWFNRRLFRGAAGVLPGVQCKNGDASSSFLALPVSVLPAEFIRARKRYTAAVSSLEAPPSTVTVADDALISSYWEGWQEGVARRLAAQESPQESPGA